MINYRGKPLFGQDSSVSNTSEFFAIAGTIVFWLLFLIFSFVIKPQPKKQYKEVQIVLSSTPVVQKSEEAPAPAEAASASAASAQSEPAQTQPVIETPSAPAVKETPNSALKKVETPKPTAQPKKEPAPAPQKTVSEPIEYAVDPMEAFANQTAKKPKQDFDWSQFDDDEAEENLSGEYPKEVKTTSFISDEIAGKSTLDKDNKLTSSSPDSPKNQKSSEGISKVLEGIKKTPFQGRAPAGMESETNIKAKTSGSGKVEMEMSNGRSRALISPASPVINLSAPAAATIDASITVSISFRVNEKGNVSGVTISPSSAFKDIVKQEITGQLLDWLFEPADYSATATFEYKIVKK